MTEDLFFILFVLLPILLIILIVSVDVFDKDFFIIHFRFLDRTEYVCHNCHEILKGREVKFEEEMPNPYSSVFYPKCMKCGYCNSSNESKITTLDEYTEELFKDIRKGL